MTNIPQCWAYNSTGKRCEQPAGHSLEHTWTMRWSDSECFSPENPPQIIPTANPALDAIVAAATEPPPRTTKCVACQHQHRGGECKCGCHEHIG